MTPKPTTIERFAQMTKQDVIQQAQRTANREGKPMAVLNLNVFSPLYVIRDWDNRFNGQRELVVRIDPQRPTISEEQAKAMTLARYYAKRNVREEWKRRKIKLSHVDAKDLTKAAIDYLEAHPELIEEAKRSLCST